MWVFIPPIRDISGEQLAQQATPHLFPSPLWLPPLLKAELGNGQGANESFPSKPQTGDTRGSMVFPLLPRAGLELESGARAPLHAPRPRRVTLQALITQSNHPTQNTPSQSACARRGQAPGSALVPEGNSAKDEFA